MFGGKKSNRPKRDHSDKNLAQYGLFDVPTDLSFDDGGVDDGDDGDFEAELLALTSGGGNKPPKRRPRKPQVPTVSLDAMIADSLRDIPSEEELSGDDDDPDLLSELNELTGGIEEPEEVMSPKQSPTNLSKLLQERLKLYEAAEGNAKATGETSRARRFCRGIKTLKDLIKQNNAGKPVNNDDIPPEVSVTVHKAAASTDVSPTEPAVTPPEDVSEDPPSASPEHVSTPPPLAPEKQTLVDTLNTRKDQYKMAALTAKKSGDRETAINYIKIAKQFEAVVKAVTNGQEVDLSNMPGPPGESSPKIEQNKMQTSPTEPEASEAEASGPAPGLITASSVAEALEQRLELYKKQQETAKEEGNSGKVRRMGRIVKQFEDAIKLNKAGKTVPLDDLPCPPGYAPIPGSTPKPDPAAAVLRPAPASPVKPAPAIPATPGPSAGESKPSPPERGTSGRASGNHAITTRAAKQLQILLARQKEFKDAALNAKKKGEITQAKEYLRTAKGFDPVIEAAKGGFPVDFDSLPVPPSAKSYLEEEFADSTPIEDAFEVDPDDLNTLTRLEQQLTKQLKMCLSTRDHNKAIGDVAGTNRFEHLALSVTRDLDIIRLARKKLGSAIPKFHYETKKFSIVKSNTDLQDNDLELNIIRGVNFTGGKDLDTYVKFEFPYPQEEPVRNKTSTCKNSNNPEFNAMFVLPMNRTARACQRVFKRHGIKLEVYSKGPSQHIDHMRAFKHTDHRDVTVCVHYKH